MFRIAVYGSECTGKTTLANELAAYYKTLWVPEYSRDYAQSKPVLDVTDVIPIIRGQIAYEEKTATEARKNGANLIVCDTIPLSSLAYSLYYNHEIPEKAIQLAMRHYDLYLFTDTDVPWQADGVRGQQVDRIAMHQLFHQQLTKFQLAYTLITGSYTERFTLATQMIDHLLQNPPCNTD